MESVSRKEEGVSSVIQKKTQKKKSKYKRRLLNECKHCHRWLTCQSRGLCWKCWHTPGVKNSYPVLIDCRTIGVGTVITGIRRYPTPTQARPGTPEKVAVLEARAEAGEHLWHPDDAGDAPDTPYLISTLDQITNSTPTT